MCKDSAISAMMNGNSAQIVVLVVDDEDSIRRLIRNVLESAGYEVLDASNGHDGLALCQGHEGAIDILLTDLVMPGMGGHELVTAALGVRPNLIVLMMSGYSEEAVFDTKRPASARTAFLQKPFTSKGLQQKLRLTLASASAAA